MTALGSGAPDRESTTDEAPRRGIGRELAAILAIGLVFRLILAYAIDGLRGSGFGTDLTLFNYWADTLAEHGPWGFYAAASYADYTPGYLYALWPIGALRDITLAFGWPQDIVDNLIKLPAILTDLAVAAIVASMALELGVSRRRALIVAVVVTFNPIFWFDSVIWGQVDSFGTVFLLLGIRELWRGRHERAAVLAVIAALVKPQLAILVPIVAVVVIRRALWPAGGHGDDGDPPARRRTLAWERRDIGWLRILTVGVTGFVTAVLLTLPFGLTVLAPTTSAPFVESSLLRLVFSTAATYPYLTVNAYNWWALFPVDGQSAATAGGALWIADSPVPDAATWGAIGPLPAGLVGAALLLGTAALVAYVVARRPDRLTILVGVSVLALAFFAAPTRVHERYLFPFFGLAAVLLAISWRWAIAYVVAGLATFLNMYVVLVVFYPDNPGVSDWLGIGTLLRDPLVIGVIALAHSAVFLWGIAQLRAGANRALRRELAHAGEPDPSADEAPALRVLPPDEGPLDPGAGGPAAAPRGGPVRVYHAPTGPGVATATAASAAAAPAASRLLPAWYDRPSWTEMGPIAWLRARINETPLRPDRSARLAGEGRGRIDRLDLLLVLVLVVGALILRTYRLGDPARMHFDEVYHARTAAEFLQDWRYGIDHEIYEWTHPHLAKYAMAAGIVAFAGHDVASTSDLGVPVLDAAVEPRREDPGGAGELSGDRIWIATGSELVAMDQASRQVAARWSVPGASAVTFDDDSLLVLVGTDAGEVLSIDATALDLVRGGPPDDPGIDPFAVATLEAGITALEPYRGGALAAAITDDGDVVVFGIDAGEVIGSVPVAGAVDLESPDDVNAVLVLPAVVEDPEGQAARLAELTGGDEASLLETLTSAEDNVSLGIVLDAFQKDDLKAAMDAGELPGVEFQPVATMVVAGADGLTFIDAGARVFDTLELDGAGGLAQVSGVDDGNQLYVTSQSAVGRPQLVVVQVTGDAADTGPDETHRSELPGPGTTVVFDEAAELVEILGITPDGTQPTVYVVEPHADPPSVFADHKLSFTPAALALDHDPQWPSSTTGELLAFSGDGTTAAMNVSSYHFAWRLPGAIMGALTVAVLFLLARVLFARREVALLVGIFAVLDGMLFVQSRIAMNDVYTGFFILAAYLLFAWMWLQPERVKRAFWVVAPAMGVLLGLALASKWVAAYAIGALGILVLMRSALGRVLLVVGMVGITSLLSWIALAVPAETGGTGNLPFVLIMIGLTLATVVISVYRPVEWSDDEVRFAVGAPAVTGILVWLTALSMGKVSELLVVGPVQFTPLQAGFALVALGIVAYAAFAIGGRLGVGPLARPDVRELDDGTGPPPATPAPDGWVRLGWGLGIPAVWLGVCLLVIPLGVYLVSYWPWAQLGGNQIFEGLPAGHAGETLLELTRRMYDYHNGLTSAHAASSPWWAWPLNLKPVWFYQGSYAEGTAASIYDAGNMVIWWLGIPAMAFVAWQAYKRRSLALALILVAFLCQWVSWARIDRASFQYHYYTSLPFVILALGYFVAEIWNGPSRRVWLLARVSAAVALMGPVILWLLRYPLCAVAGVESVNAGSQACNGNPGNLVVTPATAAMVIVALVTALALVWQLIGLSRPREDGRSLATRDLLPLVLTAAVGGIALAIARLLPDGEPLFTVNGVVPELIALIAAVPLGLIAVQVLTARDAQRFVAGLVASAGVWFVILYPNIAALPMPAAIVNAYQGLLPTYLYAFQFNVNTTPRPETSFADPAFLVLVLSLVAACAVMGYFAWAWRQALAAPPEERGPAGETGPA